ncbi:MULTISPECIES: hypothetical protein [Prevotellaceae]|jgi:hypothetical protein|uniref:Uncharacterized protein n=1 Tax=Segatella oris C735 TaxID=563008 RepID=D7NFJ1_9BACT|nr:MULTISPECIES: hypothetical protein [Prevotellaceae]EFI47636.1 conserved hypothetical protein [Segatella oris C735]MBW4908032.1 hypothetical protein [Segatella salivae]OFO78486.1 hypothetical protein HMPREF3018_06110 [Prevotella sp. HMSC077E08]OFP60751.1 hypothetical protein HMPREF2983_04295 [Prevotella sp. HMSC077E09]
MIKYTENKKQVLVENFSAYNGEEPATLRGYVEREADNDPNFFGWLFDDGNIESYSDLTDEQKQEYKDFVDSLSDASLSDQSQLEELAVFNEDETSLYFKEKDLERNGYDMLDITEAYPEYDFVERESDGRLVFHLNDEK